MTTTLEQISDLEARYQAMLNDTESDLATFDNNRRRAILAEMKDKLDQLWNQERENRASRRNSNQSKPRRHI